MTVHVLGAVANPISYEVDLGSLVSYVPTAAQISNRIAIDIEDDENGWDVSLVKFVGQIWANVTRTLTAASDSSGVTTLLNRITALLETKTEADTRQTALLDAIGDVEVTTIVNPILAASITRSPTSAIKAYVGETATWLIAPVNASGNSVNVSAMTLRVVIEDATGTDIEVVENANITKTATTYSFATSTANANVLTKGRWSCRKTDTGEVISAGPYIVDYATGVD
jgi:hypothetical protein